MIFISPTGSFNNPRVDLTANDAGQLVKVQIENSFALGWKKEDILLFTNFDFQYGEIKSEVLKNVEFFDRKPQVSKINAIIKLFEQGIIKKGETYWFHDLDAFQLELINPSEIKLKNNEIALTDFGNAKRFRGEERWNTGSIFFKLGSFDIFKQMKKVCYKKQCDEEEALGLLVIGDNGIRKRVRKLNITYNFNGFHLKSNYKKADKPIKMVHFHPYGKIRQLKVERPIDFFLGQNELHMPLISERLIKIFKYHRIT